jgi:hypothetical protein
MEEQRANRYLPLETLKHIFIIPFNGSFEEAEI